MKMYKWFVWSPALSKYIPFEGVYPFSRAMYPHLFGAHTLDSYGISKSFSIPSINN